MSLCKSSMMRTMLLLMVLVMGSAAMSGCSTQQVLPDSRKVDSDAAFLESYSELVMMEDRFVAPKGGDGFYQREFPYQIFWADLNRESEMFAGVRKCKASLFRASSGDREIMKEKIIVAVHRYGVADFICAQPGARSVRSVGK